jgi:hypothetical protein
MTSAGDSIKPRFVDENTGSTPSIAKFQVIYLPPMKIVCLTLLLSPFFTPALFAQISPVERQVEAAQACRRLCSAGRQPGIFAFRF